MFPDILTSSGPVTSICWHERRQEKPFEYLGPKRRRISQSLFLCSIFWPKSFRGAMRVGGAAALDVHARLEFRSYKSLQQSSPSPATMTRRETAAALMTAAEPPKSIFPKRMPIRRNGSLLSCPRFLLPASSHLAQKGMNSGRRRI